MWVYINSEPGLWTVGFYAPDGEWHTDSDWNDRNDAREKMIVLNGGQSSLVERVVAIEQRLDDLEDREVSPYEAAMIVERANKR